jgi:hypothetical protein
MGSGTQVGTCWHEPLLSAMDVWPTVRKTSRRVREPIRRLVELGLTADSKPKKARS